MRNSLIIKSLSVVSAGLSIVFLINGCSTSVSGNRKVNAEAVVEGYATLVYAAYTDALTSAVSMQQAISVFLHNPNDSTQLVAQHAWREARKWYAQTETFRFYDGPIDNGVTGVEGLLNAWPLDEAYVDYVAGASSVGIIQNVATYPEITRNLLVDLNEKGGEENISCGFHAIEFMLWGQDLDSVDAGKRPSTDFIAGNPINDRRRKFLELSTSLLVEHLELVKKAWSPDVHDNYRHSFIAAPADESLQKILTGLGVMAKVELAGERMYTAYDNADQEDEQSCFSDNTSDDLIYNLMGIANVYRGSMHRLAGDTLRVVSLSQLLELQHGPVAETMQQQLQKTYQSFVTMPQPFDRAIIRPDARQSVMESILAVQELGEQFATIATTLGLTINVSPTQ
ncbi:MAG TPA: imelysin family protein [Chitinophagales bacterium]|nr:imelysin family protein [Chitinophagales bacterium]